MRFLLFNFLIVLATLSLMTPVPSYSAIEAVQFEDNKTLERYQSLIAELRCLVCQNQNLADSDADLAKDLRRKTSEMLKAGKSDKEILQYMRERYGDFVLYRPPLNASTWLLWLGPFVLLLIALVSILFRIKHSQNASNETSEFVIDDEQRQKIRDLLNQDSIHKKDN